MPRKTIQELQFSKIYPMYVQKVERKGRTKAELDELIEWLTGYDAAAMQDQIDRETTFETFFDQATLNPKADRITGAICGYRVEDIEDPIARQVRMLDKIVDELARGKAMEKIKRS